MPMKSVRTPFANMTFSPDVPATALGPTEYNAGLNVETDVRGVRSVNGDEEILNSVPGTPTFVTGGFRLANEFWFIVATVEGYWWASNGVTDWYNITPGGGPISGYAQNTNITEAWNGTVPIFNDTVGAPMFWPDSDGAIMTQYSNLIKPVTILDIAYDSPTTQKITIGAVTSGSSISGTLLTVGTLDSGILDADYTPGDYVIGPGVAAGTQIVSNDSGTGSGSTWIVNIDQTVGPVAMDISPYTTAPYIAGQQILITGVNNFFNGTYTVVDSTLSYIQYVAVPGSGYPGFSSSQTVSPAYTWNYNPNWKSVIANFLRIYSTPNVGSILVAGNLTATNLDDTTSLYPVTVQWSQSFGLNEAPKTWQPTIINVANQVEVPLRGPALDAFPCNGQFFLCSYWDTVVFSPLNYSTTSAPILGIRQFNQGRGLLSSNCWANTDKLVYGIDARDIWVFDGSDFKGLGNQRVRNWLFDQLDPQYYDRVFMETNTQKYQIEIYYPDRDAVNGVPNKMLSYRYDIDCFNAPRDIESATFSCESPVWNSNVADLSSRCVVYARGQANVQLLQTDQGFSFANATPISSTFRRDNIKLAPDYNNHVMVHRILPETVNLDAKGIPLYPSPGNVTVTIEGAYSVGSIPTSKTPVEVQIATDYPWAQIDQNEFRVNTLEISNTSNTNVWMCSAVTWQVTQVEDDR